MNKSIRFLHECKLQQFNFCIVFYTYHYYLSQLYVLYVWSLLYWMHYLKKILWKCLKSHQHLILVSFSAIPKNFDPTFCLTDVFICKSAKYCIPRQNECDGKLHCDDGSDEIDCVIVSNFKAPGDDLACISLVMSFLLFLH